MSATKALGSLVVGLLAAAVVTACGQPSDRPAPAGGSAGSSTAETAAEGQQLLNEEWRLLKMATAHGNMVIEVEVADPERALDIARRLREPLGDDYAEVLVYIHRMGEGGQMPVKRIRWTAKAGYEVLVY